MMGFSTYLFLMGDGHVSVKCFLPRQASKVRNDPFIKSSKPIDRLRNTGTLCVIQVIDANIKTKIIQFFTAHPLLGFIGCLGSLASMVALPFALFPWLASPRTDLSFCVYPVRTPIIQIERRSDVTVSYKGKIVNGDVTAMQFAVWNAGREPIMAGNILAPIVLHLATNQIMEVSILKPARDVCEFQLVTNGIVENRIGMSWRILERNDGAVIQIVYSGGEEVPFALDGILVGQRILHQVTTVNKEAAYRSFLLACIAISFILLGVALTLIVPVRIVAASRKTLLGLFMVLIALVAAKYFYQHWIYQRTFTPFGF
jgi:hypothetical protein